MLGRIIELSSDGMRVSLERGFLAIDSDAGSGRVALDDIEAVIASAHALSYTNAALAALAERGAPLVICSRSFAPVAVVMPIAGHFEQGARMAAQAAASKPLAKRIWSQIVRAKITAQAEALERVNAPSERLRLLARTIRSGDPANHEAQAAQAYWPAMMGKGFRREREGRGPNAQLNYGYAVLRAASARAIAAAGLHPSLSVHHQSRGDALRLADDLMEPFRPAVDLLVRELLIEGRQEVDPETKRRLAGVLHADYRTPSGVSNLSTCLSRLSLSLAHSFLGKRKDLEFPKPAIPLLIADDQAE